MRIANIIKEEERIFVEVDIIPNHSFMFNLGDIKDQEDLLNKLKYSVKCHQRNQQHQKELDNKGDQLVKSFSKPVPDVKVPWYRRLLNLFG